MLKLKDNVDLNELEKYGFKKDNCGYIYYPLNNSPNTKYFSSMRFDTYNKDGWSYKVVSFSLENMSMWCNDLYDLESDFENIKKSYISFKEKINELKENGMLEEIE